MIPVRIMQAPHKIEFTLPKIQAPPQWNPVIAHERNFGEHKEKIGKKYYETYVVPDQQKWKSPSVPMQLTEEENHKEDHE